MCALSLVSGSGSLPFVYLVKYQSFGSRRPTTSLERDRRGGRGRTLREDVAERSDSSDRKVPQSRWDKPKRVGTG